MPIAPRRADDAVIQTRLLVGLCGHHEGVEGVTIPVFPEEVDHFFKPLAVLVGECVFDVLGVLEIALEEHVAEQSARAIGFDKAINSFLETGCVATNGPAEVAARSNREILMNDDVGQHLRPEFRQIVVGDGDLDESGVDHLQQVLGLEILAGCDDLDLLETPFPKRCVEVIQTLPVTARGPDEDPFAREVIQSRESG